MLNAVKENVDERSCAYRIYVVINKLDDYLSSFCLLQHMFRVYIIVLIYF